MTQAAATELANLVLMPVPGLQFIRHGRGRGIRYVVSDLRRGKHLSLRPDAYRLLGSFDGSRTIGEIYAGSADVPAILPPPDAAGRVIVSLYSAGLLAGDTLPVAAPVAAAGPLEAKLVSWRRELVELVTWLPLFDRLLGWMFTRAGVVVWTMTATIALWTLTARPLTSTDAFAWFAQLDAGEALGLYLVFLVLKAIHEIGHAVAYRRLAAAEGVAVDSVRAGLALMFLVPFPFTNVTGAWRLTSRLRRTMIGAAGMYVESWAALAGVLLWAWSSDPLVRAAAGQVAAVSSITTVLFNLNPLGRMDGYYIFADLIDRPNLARQASQAALAALARITGALSTARIGSIEVPMLAYWCGALLFRVTIYTALFWTAVQSGWPVAIIVLLIAGSLLIARPLIGSLRWLLAVAEDRRQTRRTLIAMAMAIVAALFIPFPSSVSLDGVVERVGLAFVFPPRAARVSASGMLRFSTAEADLDRAEIEARHGVAVAQWRQALDEGNPDARLYGDAAGSLDEQAKQLRHDSDGLSTSLYGGGVTPLDLDDRRGSVVPIGGRPVAVRLPSTAFIIRAVGHESDRTAIDRARTGHARPLDVPVTFGVNVRAVIASATYDLPSAALGRPAGGPIAIAPNDRTGRRAANPVIILELVAKGAAPPLRHGQRVEIRLERPSRPLISQLYHSLTLALGTAARE